MQSTVLLLLAFAACAAATNNFFRDPKYSDEFGVAGQGCCLPTQWEGRVGSFYMKKRFLRPVFRMSDSKVGLDYKNKRIGSRSLLFCRKNKKVYKARSVADFKAKKAYFIYNNKCKVFKLKRSLSKPCIPDDFKRFSSYSYGANGALRMWPYGKRDSRLEYFTVVTKNSCVPIKGAYRTRRGKRTITYGQYQYYNITTGNSDRELYRVPSICDDAEVQEEEAPTGLFGQLRSKVYQKDAPFSENSDFSSVGDEAMSHMLELINGNGAMIQKNKPSKARRWLRKKLQSWKPSFD